MDNTEAMNRILSHACPSQQYDDGTCEFYIELHCVMVKVIAKSMGKIFVNDEYDYSTFDIDSIEFMDA